MKVSNMLSSKGNPVPNQFVITDEGRGSNGNFDMNTFENLMAKKRPERTGETRDIFEIYFRDGATPIYLLREELETTDFNSLADTRVTRIKSITQYKLSNGYWEY